MVGGGLMEIGDIYSISYGGNRDPACIDICVGQNKLWCLSQNTTFHEANFDRLHLKIPYEKFLCYAPTIKSPTRLGEHETIREGNWVYHNYYTNREPMMVKEIHGNIVRGFNLRTTGYREWHIAHVRKICANYAIKLLLRHYYNYHLHR